ncbi:hypothetical protein ACF06P_39520 [Streptomyces sp. NPDC015684]|uniref:hypothetical protein n=1 Tax=unclassified Streptomyces TaxID=2593676 RepID=UPI0036FE7559
MSSSSSSQGALDARPTASSSSLVKTVTRYPLTGDSPWILVAGSEAGAWHTIAGGLPEASYAVSSRPTSAS